MLKRIVPAIAILFGLSVSVVAAPNLTVNEGIPEGVTLVDADAELTAAASRKTYIVLMKDEPAIRYTGGEPGFAATAPAPGADYDANASHVRMYANHLTAKHDELLANFNATDRKIYSYSHAMNGFAAELTAKEVAALRKRNDVAMVFEDYAYEINTNDTSDFLGLNDRRDGLRRQLNLKGEDIVIGVIDTGAVPQHPSFAETRDFELPRFCDHPRHRFEQKICKKLIKLRDKVVYDDPEGWNGICEVGEGWTEEDCNNKLIGARFYPDGYAAAIGFVDGEFISPRDSSGHGTHTASTAGGNNVIARLSDQRVARISGVAPRARIAVYKACWLGPGQTTFSCFFSDTAAATQDAILDGVDVLNFSVGTALSFVDQQDLAFFDAAAAGIFVARSGGNSGPGFATTNAGEPWVMTVGASTTDGVAFVDGARVNAPASVAGTYTALEGTITEPLSVTGPITEDLSVAEPVLACDPLTNPDAIAGKIALIARGICSFDIKVGNAVAAGAAAVIVYSDDRPKVVMGGDTSNPIPGVMVDNEVGLALQAEIEAMVTVNATLDSDLLAEEKRVGNIMADFSSRGPYTFEDSFLKPDITAPGVQILAGDSPDQADGSPAGLFGYKSGTSMSSPHVAGLGALLIEARPDWSPAQVKSALMTTARQDVFKEDGATPADPFDFGAGHADPNPAVSPALTYDVGAVEYAAATCGTAGADAFDPALCDFLADVGFSTDPADLNLPSIAIGGLPGSKTITRTVTAVADYEKPFYGPWWSNKKRNKNSGPQKYVAQVEAPPGFAVEVSPKYLYLAPGQSASYELTITNETAVPNSWQFGAITWESKKGNDVRSPIAVNAAAFITEDEIDGEGPSGFASFDLTFGYTGDYTAGRHGLNPPGSLSIGTFADGGGLAFDFGAGASGDPAYSLLFFDVPPGTAQFRYATHTEYTAGGVADDIDLYLYYCPNFSCSLVDSSASAGSDEVVEVQFPIPAAGTFPNPYLLFVHAFDMASPVTDAVTFRHSFGVVDDAGNLTDNAPELATVGETVTIDVGWDGLFTGPFEKTLGAISHSDANGVQDLTVLDIENDQGEDVCSGLTQLILENVLGRPVAGCPESATP